MALKGDTTAPTTPSPTPSRKPCAPFSTAPLYGLVKMPATPSARSVTPPSTPWY
eukprot:CAMPEP_0201285544 /NCGR_PEP_ID=MMETSP1317-20130820/111184_1 /ASSEMBLY_ACC=CAM_ASM_000770 /TAXON_ID=187299 /ORGANISM="Undescribed Undescribed, Strain Undescribed" /LENGTH=53 /DNA_ID=CAMNT_0047610865 /DNA_START=53 /DNA_END=211 /DNA_ORIENTATION=-